MASTSGSVEAFGKGDDIEDITDETVEKGKEKRHHHPSTEECIKKKRKGGPTLYCKKHAKDIELYCKTHGVACCYLCAMIDHRQSECVQQDIAVVIRENKAKLKSLKEKAVEESKSHQIYGNHIHNCKKDTDKHLHVLKTEVDLVFDEAMKTDKDREQQDAAKINREIDDKNKKIQEQIQKLKHQIQKNDEKREKRLKLNHTISEKRRQPIENKQRSLHADFQNITEETERKICELEKSWQNETETTENAIKTLDTVLEDDQNVVKDGHHVITSMADKLDKPLNEGRLKHITRTVSGVRFVKSAGREKYYGRIDGYDWEWRCVDTFNIKLPRPIIAGCIDECNVIITDNTTILATYTYMLDMNTKHSQRLTTGSRSSWVTYACALLNDDKIVFGKRCTGCTGDSLTGCISVYDRQWKLINDITIPRNSKDDLTSVHVAVDQEGMIIAAEWGQSNIYVINAADGKIMNTITCKQNIVMRGVLSSGHIIAQPDSLDHRVFIIDREGAQREITHSDVIWNVCIDPMTDDLYVESSDDEYKTCVIEQVMSGGDMKKRRVASFPLSVRPMKKDLRHFHLLSSCVMMTSSGNMIVSDGDNILVFKKMFSL